MKPGEMTRFEASTTKASDAAMSGWISRILPSSISTSALAKSPSWRSMVSTTPPLSRIRREPCRRLYSASIPCAEAVCEIDRHRHILEVGVRLHPHLKEDVDGLVPDPLRPRRRQRGPILAGFALHLTVLDREVDLSGAGIAVHHLELCAEQPVAQHRQYVAVGRGGAGAEDRRSLGRILERLHWRAMPRHRDEHGLCDAADPAEFRRVEQRVLTALRQRLEQLFECQPVLHGGELGPVGGRLVVDV